MADQTALTRNPTARALTASLFPAGRTLPAADAEALLTRATPFVDANEIIEPYLFAVELEDGRIRAVSVRETIRQAGPTVRLDLGKQAELADVHG